MSDLYRRPPKKNSVGLIAIIIVLLLMIGGAFWWLVDGEQAFGGALSQLAGGKQSEQPPATAPAEKRTIEKTFSGAGEVKSSATEKLKPAKYTYFKQTTAPLNKLVRAGEALLEYTYGDPLVAPYDLVVKSYNVPKEREELSHDDHYVEVERVDTVNIAMSVPENDLPSIAVGQTASVVFGNGIALSGTVADIAQVGTYNASGSKFTVTISVPNDGSLWLGMSATLSVKTAEAVDVLSVPISAVKGSGDAKTVSIYDPNNQTTRDVTVTTGLSDGTFVEVNGAVKEGDLVVLQDANGSADPTNAHSGMAVSSGAAL